MHLHVHEPVPLHACDSICTFSVTSRPVPGGQLLFTASGQDCIRTRIPVSSGQVTLQSLHSFHSDHATKKTRTLPILKKYAVLI